MAVHPASRAVAPCAEFPNDNPALHEGAIWCCVEIRGEAVCERAARPLENPPELVEPTPTEPIVLTAEEPPSSGEIPEAPEVPDVAAVAPSHEESVSEDEVSVSEEEAFDVLDELMVGDVVVEESPPEEAAPAAEAPTEDPFAALMRVLEDVARAAEGTEEIVQCVRALLGATRLDPEGLSAARTEALVSGGLVERTERGIARAEGFSRQVIGWQGVLRGESEDFAACGAAMLDEWCAQLLARATGNPSRAEGFRRELRRRGVAAFGLVASAA